MHFYYILPFHTGVCELWCMDGSIISNKRMAEGSAPMFDAILTTCRIKRCAILMQLTLASSRSVYMKSIVTIDTIASSNN